MRKFRHSFVVQAEISRVWEFYTDIGHLRVITPEKLNIQIVRSTHQKLIEGSEVWLAGRLVTKSRWHSRITSMKEYEYVDEMLSGIFKVWRHAHKFNRIADSTTEVVDDIDFELPYGVIGRLFEGYVYRRLVQTFDYRKHATIRALERS
ncbi:MAG: SRPBCC family protein [Nitrososphaera sp.]